MIEYVYGPKGSGKTKKMIDMANAALETCEGNIIFLNDRDKYRVTVDTKIRFTNLDEFGIVGSEQLFGFISGKISENYDVKMIFIDNIYRIINYQSPEDIYKLVGKIKKIAEEHKIEFVLSMSCEKGELPDLAS